MTVKSNDDKYGLSSISDIANLKQFINSIDNICHCLQDPMFAIKSIDSKTIYFSEYWAEQIGISKEVILGSIVCPGAYEVESDIEAQIKYEDQVVISEKQGIITVKNNYLDGSIVPYYCQKSPIINPGTNKVIGILCQGYLMSLINVHQILMANTNQQLHEASPKLTQREKQVVFLFLSQFGSQQIADTLTHIENKTVTKSTIDSIFNDKLYPKFNVFNRKDLYTKLNKLGFTSHIPQDLLKTNSIIIDNIKVY